MGNKMCKKKSDSVDSGSCKSPTPFDRIINRLHLRPNTWKSDSQLSDKQIKRSDVHMTPSEMKQEKIVQSQPLSKSSDWTEVDLEVPEKDHIHLQNPKLSIIFSSNENITPTPPPRKHKKNFREKLEAVAKSAFQSNKKPVEEQLCVKKTINYKCPLCDEHEINHNRNHHHHHEHQKQSDNGSRNKKEGGKDNVKSTGKNAAESKRKKNLSVVSLPNYNELKLTVAQLDDRKKGSDPLTDEAQKTSLSSFQNDSKKSLTGSTGKLDSYITRCRSFGSLLPQQFKKLKVRKAPADVESDDSFGALEDWDLGLIEHYNPKEASLPRPKKEDRSSQEIISDLESLIVKDEDIQEAPKPPVRRSESLLRKISREGSQSAQNLRTHTRDSNNPTPPPSPLPRQEDKRLFLENLPTQEDGHVEHSSLIRILEEFSIKDKQEKQNQGNEITHQQEEKILNKPLFNNNFAATDELVKKRTILSIEDFINAEKINTNKDLNFRPTSGTIVS